MLNIPDRITGKANIYVKDGTLYVKIKKILGGEDSLYLEKLAKTHNLNLRMSKADMCEEEIQIMRKMDLFLAEMEAIPESEKHPMSKELLDRMQSEAETNALMPDESREWLRKILRGEKLD